MPKILIVDDSPTVLKVMGCSLAAQGLEVKTAAAGTAALDMIRAEHFDALVLDIHLPDIDGLEVLKILKGDPALSALPVMLLSGQDDMEHVQQGIALGAKGFLPKHSTSPKALIERLRGILGRS